MSVEELVAAMRAADGDAPALAEATQARVMGSLAARGRGRHRLVGVLTCVGVLLAGTVSWALATGELAALWTAAPALPEPAPAPVSTPLTSGVAAKRDVAPAVALAEPTPPPPVVVRAPEVAATPPPVVVRVPEVAAAPVAPTRAPAVAPPPVAITAAHAEPGAPRPREGAQDATIEARYRRAHQLHFHGADPAAALAAWDAYLAAEPTGRFAIEARYNRALMLTRLGRYAEARAAFEPFARGEIEPAGYRQAEAVALVTRLGALILEGTR